MKQLQRYTRMSAWFMGQIYENQSRPTTVASVSIVTGSVFMRRIPIMFSPVRQILNSGTFFLLTGDSHVCYSAVNKILAGD